MIALKIAVYRYSMPTLGNRRGVSDQWYDETLVSLSID